MIRVAGAVRRWLPLLLLVGTGLALTLCRSMSGPHGSESIQYHVERSKDLSTPLELIARCLMSGNFREVLTGFVHQYPEIPNAMVRDAAGNPTPPMQPGENGLTKRIETIAFLWKLSRGYRRAKFLQFGLDRFYASFQLLLGSTDVCLMVELLRIMDKKSYGNPGKPNYRENLTVSLCHVRLQDDPALSTEQKSDEAALYKLLDDECVAVGLEHLRNRIMFHSDHADAIADPDVPSVNLENVYRHLIAWYRFVAPLAYRGRIPMQIDKGEKAGRDTAIELRRTLFASLRAQLGRPVRRRPVARTLDDASGRQLTIMAGLYSPKMHNRW